MSADRYTVKIVFRGLCMARKAPGSTGLDVYLPDLSIVPQPTAEEAEKDPRLRVLREAKPFREHHAVLEFHQASWENQSKVMRRLLRIDKPTKEPVALYLLQKEEIHIRGMYEHLAASPERPRRLAADEERYSRLGGLLLLDRDDDHGFDQLPGYRGEMAGDAPQKCAAMVSLTVGEALTARRSQKAGEAIQWSEVRVVDGATVSEPRAFNLDIVVRFTLPAWNPLLVTCVPIGDETLPNRGRMVGDERSFILKPAEGADEVTLWIKNREMAAILVESDADPDPYPPGCPGHHDELDRDLAMLAVLAKEPNEITVPKRASGPASDCGSGCGSCNGGGP